MAAGNIFTTEELELAKKLAYVNFEKEDTEIGFEHLGQWITNPFLENSGRFEFTDFDAMCEYYGKENVCGFLSNILTEQNPCLDDSLAEPSKATNYSKRR